VIPDILGAQLVEQIDMSAVRHLIEKAANHLLVAFEIGDGERLDTENPRDQARSR